MSIQAATQTASGTALREWLVKDAFDMHLTAVPAPAPCVPWTPAAMA